jgi:anthranilate synthase component 1
VRLFERIPDRHASPKAPLASFSFYRSLVAFDHVLQRILLIADAEPGRRAALRGRAVDAGRDRGRPAAAAPALFGRCAWSPARSRGSAGALGDDVWYRDAVLRAKEYIAAGDIFQVVLSRRGTIDCPSIPSPSIARSAWSTRRPTCTSLKEGSSAVAGASPEMLVRVEGRRVETRPIAGTRPRGASEEDDQRLERELLSTRRSARST